MPIFDRGYRHWSGRFLGPLYRWSAITKTVIKIGFRSVIIKRFIWLAWIPAGYFAIIFFLIGKSTQEGNLANFAVLDLLHRVIGNEALGLVNRNTGEVIYFIWERVFHALHNSQMWVIIILSGIVGSPLISNDIRGKSFLLYYSRPITLFEYFVGKFVGVLFFIAFVSLIPNLVIYIISVAFSPSLNVLAYTYDIIGKIFLSYLAVGIPITLMVLFLSSLTKEPRYAAFAWFAMCIGGEIGFRILSAQGTNDSFLISFAELVRGLLAFIYRVGHQNVNLVLMATGFLCLFALVITFRKITAPIRL